MASSVYGCRCQGHAKLIIIIPSGLLSSFFIPHIFSTNGLFRAPDSQSVECLDRSDASASVVNQQSGINSFQANSWKLDLLLFISITYGICECVCAALRNAECMNE